MKLPALDGLRGVAVLAVMAFHFSNARFQGGWLGVEVFFVLSGYLITSILLNEYRATGTISVANFYVRRALRLGPALVAGIVLADLVMLAFKNPAITPSFGIARSDAAALFYVANIVQVSNPGNIGAISHTWSLSIEEQFYLVWSAAMLLIVAKSRQPWRWALAAGVVAALITAALLAMHVAPASLYLVSTTHAIGLLLGCTAALWPRLRALATQPVAIAGAATLVAMSLVVKTTDSWMYVAGFPVVGVAATMLVAHSATSSGWLVRALSNGPLTSIGRVSYGLYVYHIPILLVAKALAPSHTFTRLALLTAAWVATFAVAYLSYRWIEKPALRIKNRWSPRSLAPSPRPAPVMLGNRLPTRHLQS